MRAPHFDPALGAWVISRYADVLAAFREPGLWPVRARDEAAHVGVRAETLAALSPARLAAWQSQIEPLAHRLLEQLLTDRAVDLVGEFAQPWSLAVAVLVTGADAADGERLAALARQVSAAAAEPDDSALKSAAAAATAELERHFQQTATPLGEPAFVALSQTLPCYLANAWLALLQHPAELARLRSQPDLLPGAMDELLRYAGLVRQLFRQAAADVKLGGVRIAEGERVSLMLAAANRDPVQFPEPDRLDVTRQAAGQVALGAGPHACVGASRIRMVGKLDPPTVPFHGAADPGFGRRRLCMLDFLLDRHPLIFHTVSSSEPGGQDEADCVGRLECCGVCVAVVGGGDSRQEGARGIDVLGPFRRGACSPVSAA
jgi:cytochrome P450